MELTTLSVSAFFGGLFWKFGEPLAVGWQGVGINVPLGIGPCVASHHVFITFKKTRRSLHYMLPFQCLQSSCVARFVALLPSRVQYMDCTGAN